METQILGLDRGRIPSGQKHARTEDLGLGSRSDRQLLNILPVSISKIGADREEQDNNEANDPPGFAILHDSDLLVFFYFSGSVRA
jgi:hypothetical protein